MFSPPVEMGGATYEADMVVRDETLGVAADARTVDEEEDEE